MEHSNMMLIPKAAITTIIREWATFVQPYDEIDSARFGGLTFTVKTLYPHTDWAAIADHLMVLFLAEGGYTDHYYATAHELSETMLLPIKEREPSNEF